jgi:hypothetical protein
MSIPSSQTSSRFYAQAPELFRKYPLLLGQLLSAHLADEPAQEDITNTLQFVELLSGQERLNLLQEAERLFEEDPFPWQEIRFWSNRPLDDERAAKIWLHRIIPVLQIDQLP